MSFRKYTTSEQAILTTLLYSDSFSFPLTKDELWNLLISEKKISKSEFEKSLHSLEKLLITRDGYFCLRGKEKSIDQRIKNISEVERKMQKACLVAKKLSQISSVLFIGISGGLAVGNATGQDDIDLIIITRKDRLFVTRIFVLLFLELLGVRRSRNKKNTADTICANLLLDETALGFFGKDKDIYIAREIAQLIPIFERENAYKRFLLANKWIKDFLPNVSLTFISQTISQPGRESPSRPKGVRSSQKDRFGVKLFNFVFINSFFERLFRLLQIHIIKRHQTKEIVTKHLLAFHPNDYRFKTLRRLRLKMRQFGLLTKF